MAENSFAVPGKTALLLLHVQPVIVGMTPGGEELVPKIAEAVASARGAGVEVMYVNISYRPGYPELAADDPSRKMIEPQQLFIAGVNDGPHEGVAAEDGDIQFGNPRTNAFSGTDLDEILRLKGIDHIVLAGISTGGAVLGTANDADDRNFKVTVLSDCTLDSNPDLHASLLEIFSVPPRGIRVLTGEEWASEIAG